MIEDPATTVRLVAEPGPAAAAALRTARAGLALQRLATEPVVANRMLPTESPTPGSRAWPPSSRTTSRPSGTCTSCPTSGASPVPPTTSPSWNRPLPGPPPRQVDRRGPARPRRRPGLAHPAARRRQADLRLVRRGDELVLTVGPFRRAVPLPSALRRCTVSGAGLDDGVLRVRFSPDPDLWPRTR